jgi:uncharacterized damage-inducible protein DinB
MSTLQPHWQEILVQHLALASRLEDEGQYNIAKLARAAADALGRRAAYQAGAPAEPARLAADLRRAAARLSALGVGPALPAALERGAAALAEGRVPLIDETPHPFVCRTCGQVALGEVTEQCPTCGAWPDTFQRFMPNYWLDALEPFAALETLRRTPEDVAGLLAGLSEEAMNRPPEEGGWAIRNVVTHLRDAQQVFAGRVDLFLAEEHPVLETKAVWTWAAREEERPPTAAEIFAAYRASRNETLAKLEGMPLAWWWRSGAHQEFGPVTLRQQASYFASHERTHLPQIARLRAA